MTLNDLIKNLTDQDKETFEEHFYWNTTNNVIFDHNTDGESHGIRLPEKYIVPHSPEDLDKQVYKFDTYCNFRRLKLDTNGLDVKVVTVKNYKVAWYLRNVLKNLLEKHEDVIDEESKLSVDMKSLALHFLCRVIYDMQRTRKRDISEEVIREWYGYLKFVRRMGLRIMFVYEQLEKIKRDFVSLIPSRLESEIPNELRQKKSLLQKQIEKVESDLDKCKEYSSSSSFGVQRLRLDNKSTAPYEIHPKPLPRPAYISRPTSAPCVFPVFKLFKLTAASLAAMAAAAVSSLNLSFFSDSNMAPFASSSSCLSADNCIFDHSQKLNLDQKLFTY
ncbi:hypothetical protein F8388_006129 [Cannabis sativa]|uniref:Uncharacterized protein n=1 Tax=Cannabis sativa TaxID=3483 RepID=A0A7J6G742_CANSA|nr:hypothetical protein F8388_006129 [Cannabis sativa]KAF4404916.1 hypothetical protein G4B88_006302 [Cannabis sativa]